MRSRPSSSVFCHFSKLFDAAEDHFACVHKEPSAGTQPAAVHLSVAERLLAHLDARWLLLFPGARLWVLFAHVSRIRADHRARMTAVGR
jgi:hypothetical protein